MKRPTISPIQRKTGRSDRDLPPPEIRDLLDHLAQEIAAKYLRLLTPEAEAPDELDRPRELEVDR